MSTIILNGSDKKTFHSKGYKKWDQSLPLKIVTHHWSNNLMKGFDVYKHVDKLLEKKKKWKGNFKFTYIGNLPKDFSFKKCKKNHVKPPKW